MTKEQADTRLGQVIHVTPRFVIRMDDDAIRLHKIEDGKEMLPLGYVVGHNILVYG